MEVSLRLAFGVGALSFVAACVLALGRPTSVQTGVMGRPVVGRV